MSRHLTCLNTQATLIECRDIECDGPPIFKLWLMSRHYIDVATFKHCNSSLPQLMSLPCCCDVATLDDGHNLSARVFCDVTTFLHHCFPFSR